MTDWQSLLDTAITDFIRAHEKDDVAALALQKSPDESWPYALILDQIKARQKAAVKLPQWLEGEGLLFPPPSVMEQASSSATALYKASLFEGESFADLTGGAGADSWAFAQHFGQGYIIDADEHHAGLLAHNLPKISHCDLHIIHQTAEEFIKGMPAVDVVLIDPQRRDSSKKGKFRFEDCSPDILGLLPALHKKAQHILIKASPMLDIDEGVRQLGGATAVHVVEWRGECKELLFHLGSENIQDPPITAVSLDDDGQALNSFTCTRAEDNAAQISSTSPPQSYLYEPSPAFMKAGGFNALAQHYGLAKLHPNTHLFTSEHPTPDVPGRAFKITGTCAVDRKALHKILPEGRANITVRNFPMAAADLMKKLALKDGGDITLFACTQMDERGKDTKKLILCQRIAT